MALGRSHARPKWGTLGETLGAPTTLCHCQVMPGKNAGNTKGNTGNANNACHRQITPGKNAGNVSKNIGNAKGSTGNAKGNTGNANNAMPLPSHAGKKRWER